MFHYSLQIVSEIFRQVLRKTIKYVKTKDRSCGHKVKHRNGCWLAYVDHCLLVSKVGLEVSEERVVLSYDEQCCNCLLQGKYCKN